MKTNKLYKLIVPLLFLAGSIGVAWGQEGQPQYVTGDKFTIKSITINNPSTSISANPAGTTSNGIENGFDNNESTWWQASSSGTVTVTIDFGSTVSIGGLSVLRSGNKAQRAEKIEFLTSDTKKGTYETKYTEDNIPQGTDDQDDGYNDRYTFTFPTITTQYLQLKITPHDDSAVSAFNEMYFLPAVMHKAAKWYQDRSSLTNGSTGDTFDGENKMFHSGMMVGNEEMQIQASHTYIDTIYVHKGSKTRLTLPTIQSSEALSSVAAYQRWYSYRTDGTFAVHIPRTNDNEVYDLLTPVESYTTMTTSSGTQTINPTAHRFANGYIGNPEAEANESFFYTNSLVEMDFYYPTDTEFESWFPDAQDSKFDNNWYIVACDVSCYTDYKDWEKEQIGTYCEPTLSHRVLFYIVGVDDRDDTGTNFANWYAKLKDLSYQEATSTNYESKNFLEEYDITFPYTRVSTNTLDMVALTKDARGYAIPDAENDTEELTLTLVDEASGITFANDTKSSTISGENRVIHFKYPTILSDGSQQVSNKNAKATILVTKKVGEKTYNLVRYNLTFVPETQLLTETQIEKIDEGTAGNVYWNIPERTPKNLQEYTLVTSMTWDYKAAMEKQTGYYPFPMDWSYSSYAFYDGSKNNTEGHYFYGQRNYPQWGYYAIMKGYVPFDTGAPTVNNDYGYHLYVDASDRPGTIARLPFRRSLCAGSELLVSAMVKSANPGTNNDDAGMLFTIFRVQENKEGNTISSTPIYRHATGQIMHTSQLSEGVPHNGNEWYQVYFSFTNGDFGNEDLNPNDDIQYSYVLQIDNYSASTDGGDMYLDNVQVYVRPMTAEVTQDKPTCDDRPIVNMRINWNQLYSRISGLQGGEEEEESAIDFCIIDVDKYTAALGDNSDNVSEAIKAAAVQIGGGEVTDEDGTTSGYDEQYGTLWYKWDFEDNTEYKNDNSGLAIENKNEDGTKYYFYRETDATSKEQYLSVDIHAALASGTQYQMLLLDHNGDVSLSDFEESISDTECGMRTDAFTVEGQNLITMNGEVVGAGGIENNYCVGQTFNFAIILRADLNSNGTIEDNEIYSNENIYYDWFFGDRTAYEATTNTIGENQTVSVSVDAALEAFRVAYPYATEITDEIVATSATTPEFTEDHLKLLKYLTTNVPTDARNPQLVLRKKENEIRILETGLNLAIRPIEIEIDDDDIDADLICWAPGFLTLNPTGSKSPELNVGFGDVTYPDETDWTNPALRIGLDQIEAAPVKGSGTTINIPLRNASFAFDNSTATHLGKLSIMNGTTSTDQFDDELYLKGTNDPNLIAQIEEEIGDDGTFDSHAYSIGKLVHLYAKPHDDSDTNYSSDVMKVQFYNAETEDNESGVTKLAFEPREGYWYQFGIHFEEKHENETSTLDDETGPGCYGNLIIRMHVVPEYQKWVGDADANWNNDDNWVRSKRDELKKAADDYTDDETANGYVPMKFTKVTIPTTNKQVELYPASTNTSAGTGTHSILDLTTTEVSGTATANIEYDLMVNPKLKGETDKYYDCETYYTNTVDEIHFEPKAEMLHAELLKYEKAWVDYKLKSNQWHTLASPLKGVVAGDFYTDSEAGTGTNNNVAGTENQEYFTDITFDGTIGTINNQPSTANNAALENSRFSPSVYQRGWGKDAKMITVEETNGSPVAVQGNWSAVYNDVKEAYTPGTGFSLKVLDMPEGANSDGTAIFRLPKADGSYSYYTNGSTTSGNPVQIDRNGNTEDALFKSGQLKTNELTDADATITVPLQENEGSNYYLIGNPFMAHLDAAKFFEDNKTVLEQKYWTVTDDVQNVAASNDGEWALTTGTDIPTIAPLQSFFVQKVDNATETTVKFTADMQTLAESTSNEEASTNALILMAKTADGKVSRAAIAYDMAANRDYEASEDAELFLDSNLSDVPTIYTVAGTMATSINRTSELYNIPVGIYGNSTEMVTLSFEGLNHFSSATLYDAEEKTETPLREGTTLTVPASTSGRYFLRAGTPTANEVIETNDIQIYTLSGNRVMVTSNVPLKDIRVYTMNGAQVKHTKAGVCSFELYLADGIYLITAQNTNGETQTEKVVVR